MSKSITPTVQGLKVTRQATEPLILIQVVWPDATVYYADTDLTIGSISCLGTIAQLGSLSSVSKVDSVSDYSAISVGLIDEDGAIKDRLNQFVLDGIPCAVYHYYRGTTQSDFVLLLSGKLEGAEWQESERIYSFNIETAFESDSVGYKVDAYAFPGFNNELIGTTWPMVFGTCLEVPALKVRGTGNILQLRQTFNESTTQIAAEPQFINGLPTIEVDIEYVFTFYDFRMSAILRIDATSPTGFYLEPTEYNLSKYTNIPIKARPNDSGYRSWKRIVFMDQQYQLSNTWVVIKGYYNYCQWQNGDMCYFEQDWPWVVEGSSFFFPNNIITDVAPIVRASWASYTGINLSDNYYANLQLNLTNGYRARSWYYLREFVNGDREAVPGRFEVAQIVKALQLPLAGEETTHAYAINSIPSSEILDVWAWRNYLGERIYAQVPSSYYTKYISYDFGDGHLASAIVFDIPLEERTSEEWEDGIFVSLRSSVNHEVTTQIQYLIGNYTDLTADPVSFSEVRLKTKDFWMCFVLTDEEDVLQLIADMAWQARCALINSDGIIKIIFLPDMQTPVDVLSQDWIETDTMKLLTSPIDDVKTSINAEWKPKVSAGDSFDNDRTYIYENNVVELGKREETYQINKYNMEHNVKASVDFWGYRASNTWRVFELATFLNLLDADVFDVLTNAIDIISTNTIHGEVTGTNRTDDSIMLKCQLASRPTDIDGSNQPIEDVNYWPGNPALPDVLDPGFGRTERDYVPQVKYEPVEDQPPEPVYSFKFVSYPSSVTRGVDFAFEVLIVDQNQVQQDVTTLATVTLLSSDAGDVINVGNINFISGAWANSLLQITGGADVDTGALRFAAVDVTTGDSPVFDIVDTPPESYIWTVPASVTRNSDFTVTLENGAALSIVNIALNSSDNKDNLYDTNGLVTSVTLDGLGTFTASDWYISGGDADDAGQLQASDPLGVYLDTPSDIFDITGISVQVVFTNLFFSDEPTATTESLLIESTTDPFLEDSLFQLSVAYLDEDDNINTWYNGTATLVLYDQDGDPITLVDLGPSATILTGGVSANVTFSNGTWSFADCEITWGIITEILFVAVIDFGGGSLLSGTLEVLIGEAPSFELITPSSFARGVATSCSFIALDADGAIDTGYIPSGDITIQYVVATSDTISPISILVADWTNGIANVDLTITGGTSTSENMLIFIEEGPRYGEVNITIAPATSVITALKWNTIFGSIAEQPSPNQDDSTGAASSTWNSLYASATSLFSGDSRDNISFPVSGSPKTQVIRADQYSYVSMYTLLLNIKGSFDILVADRTDMLHTDVRLQILNLDHLIDNGGFTDSYPYRGGSLRLLFTTNVDHLNSGVDIIGAINAEFVETVSIASISDTRTFYGSSEFNIRLSAGATSYLKSIGQDRVYIIPHAVLPNDSYLYPAYTDGGTGPGGYDRGITLEIWVTELHVIK